MNRNLRTLEAETVDLVRKKEPKIGGFEIGNIEESLRERGLLPTVAYSN